MIIPIQIMRPSSASGRVETEQTIERDFVDAAEELYAAAEALDRERRIRTDPLAMMRLRMEHRLRRVARARPAMHYHGQIIGRLGGRRTSIEWTPDMLAIAADTSISQRVASQRCRVSAYALRCKRLELARKEASHETA